MRMDLKEVWKERSFVMGIAMVLVMLFHQSLAEDAVFAPFRVLGDRGVDIFFFISGMGIYASLTKNSLRRYFSNRFWRIIPTVLIIGLLKYTLPGSSGSLYTATFGGKWFIFAILFFYFSAPFIFPCIRKYGWAVLPIVFMLSLGGCIVISSGIFIGNIPIAIGNIPMSAFSLLTLPRLPAFVLGMMAAASEKDCPFGRVRPLITAFLLAGCFFVMTDCPGEYLPFLRAEVVRRAGVSFLFLPCLPTLSYLSARIGAWGERLSFCHFLIAYAGIYSLEIYLLHVYVFGKIAPLRDVIGGVPCLILAFIICYTAAWPIHWFCRQVSFFIRGGAGQRR